MKDSFSIVFAKRTVLCFFAMALLFLSGILRIAVISTGTYKEAQTEQSSYRITVAKPRGTVFDCNMKPITNSSKKLIAALSPTPRVAMAISTIFEGKKLEKVLEQLSNGKPTICEIPYDPQVDGIVTKEIYNHSNDFIPAIHTVGYQNSEGHGACGLESAYDKLLYSDETIDAVFTINGKGGIMTGIEPYFEGNNSIIGSGIISTIDINLQQLTENIGADLKRGAIILCEAESGKIRAAVSKPDFTLSTISESLNSSDSPLLNRTITAFSVGSVFKPCTAIAALENNISGFMCECTGHNIIGDRTFNCHKRDGHGLTDLNNALAFSCNSYFYSLAMKVGAERLYKTAASLSFGSSIKIADSLFTSKGVLPSPSTLTTDASLANIGIGQGALLLSPVSILTLYCAIANGGYYRLPSVVEGTVSEGKINIQAPKSPTRVMSKKTANTLRKHLISVISDGTGTEAMPTLTTAAGKTATAQTGRFENGVELTNSWFCGFFPAESPQYVAVIMSEGKNEISPAKIFSEIADAVYSYKTSE